MAKFKFAPLHNNLNIRYKYNFYESLTVKKTNDLKRKIYVSIFALNFPANKI